MAKQRALLDNVLLDEVPSTGLRLTHHQEMLAIFFIFLALFAIFTKHQGGSWNDQSRFATIEALVENPQSQPRFAIDYTTWGWWTGDKIFDGEHFYSTKPPVLSVLGAGIYYLLHNMFGLSYSNPRHEGLIYFILTFLLMGIPCAGMLALFYDMMRRMGLSKKHAVFLTSALGIGSLFLSYTLVFNNHTFAGAMVFFGFYFLMRAIEHRGSRGWNLFLSGLFTGLGLTSDIVGAAPFTAAFFLYLMTLGLQRGWLKSFSAKNLIWGPFAIFVVIGLFLKNRTVRWLGVELWGSFLLGLLVFVGLHFYFNWQITGGWKPIYAMQSLYTKMAVEGYYGEVLGSQEGIFSEGRFRYIINSLFGLRGVFLYTPILFFSFYFIVKAALDKRNRLARLALFILVFLIPSWIFLLLETKNYGGTSYASRYFIAPIPMLFFFNAYIYRYATSQKLKGWFYEAYRLSILMAVVGMAFPWGVAGELPPSNFSFFNNLQYWTQNFLVNVAKLFS